MDKYWFTLVGKSECGDYFIVAKPMVVMTHSDDTQTFSVLSSNLYKSKIRKKNNLHEYYCTNDKLYFVAVPSLLRPYELLKELSKAKLLAEFNLKNGHINVETRDYLVKGTIVADTVNTDITIRFGVCNLDGKTNVNDLRDNTEKYIYCPMVTTSRDLEGMIMTAPSLCY